MTQAVEVGEWSAVVTRGRVAAVAATLALVTTVAAAGFGNGGVSSSLAPGAAGVAVLTIAVWLVASRHPTAAQGLALAAVGEAAFAASVLLTFPGWVGATLAACMPLASVGAVNTVMGWRSRPRWKRSVVSLPAVLAALLLMLAVNPVREPGCYQGCVDVSPLLDGVLNSRGGLSLSAALVVTSLLGLAVTVLRTGRAAAPASVSVGAGLCVASGAGSLAWRASVWGTGAPLWPAFLLPTVGAIGLAGGAIVAGTLEARRRGLAIRLAQLLGDPGGPTAPVHYAVPGEDRWVCADGTAAGRADGFMVVTDAGVPIARVRADPALVKDGGRLGPARALSVRNAQLRAVARARTRDLHAARRRIVEVADAEGGRMERDLHDGAQQRLVSSALYLALAHRDTPDIAALTEAEHCILEALAHLRDIAHGLAPEALRTGGVWAGVASLATSASIPVATDLPVNGPTDEVAGTVLYFGLASVFELAADGAASGIEVRGSDASGVLRADMTVHGAMLSVSLLADAADRLAACDGLLEVSLSGDGCRVTLEVPCA